MNARLTCPYTASLLHANGQRTLVEYPHKYAGKPTAKTAAAFLAVVQRDPKMADAVRVEILDNKGDLRVLAAA